MHYGESRWQTGGSIGSRLVIAGDHAVWSAQPQTWNPHRYAIRTVDLRDGRERVGPVQGHAAPCVMGAEVIASSSETLCAVTVLATATLEPTARFEVGGEVTAIAADAQTIAAGVLDPAALVLVPRDGSQPRRVPLPDVPRIAALSPDGRFVAAGVGTEKSGGDVFVIEVASGQLRATLKGLRALPASLVMTTTDVLACAGKTALAWPILGGKSRVLLKGAKHFALLLGVTPGGLAVVGSYKERLAAVDMKTGEVRWTRDAYGPSALVGARLVSCHFRTLDEVDPETGVALASVEPPDATGMLALDATRTCTTGIVDSGVAVLPAGATEWPRRPPCAHGSAVSAVSFDGDRFATSGGDGRSFVWQRGEPRPVATFYYEGDGSSGTLACHLDGDTLITAHGHRLQRLSVATGETLAVSPPLAWSPQLIFPLPDVGRIFVATEPWRQAILHFVLLDPLTLAVARDVKQAGNYNAYARARRVRPDLIRLTNSMAWADVELPSCRIVASGSFRGYGNVVSVHHLTDDEVQVVRVDNWGTTAAERRGHLEVYRASDGTALHKHDTDLIVSAAMCPDGRFATLHADRVRLWDFAAGQLIAEVPAAGSEGTQLTWFPDGRALLLCGPHGEVFELDVSAA